MGGNLFILTPDGEPGFHYLRIGYKKFFLHIRKYLRAMAQLINAGQPVPLIMQAMKGPLAVPVVGGEPMAGKL